MRNPLAPFHRWSLRRRALARCVLGDHSVVYDPKLLHPHGGRGTIVIGDYTHVRGELLTLPGGRIRFGSWSYLGEGSRVWAAGAIEIGDRVLIAHNVTLLDNTSHPVDPDARHAHYRAIITAGHPRIDLGVRPVHIENDAWIACNCVILRGVTIGRGAVVGAASVVTKDVPPFSVVMGNPARVVRTVDPDRAVSRGDA